jgi:putative membrane protein
MKLDTPVSMSNAAEKHVKTTMAVGSLSLAISRIALPKVKHAMLKQFAEFEISEQETIADILKNMKMPGLLPSGTVKAPTDAELTGNLGPKGKDMVEKMRAMKAGPDFDREYVKAQIDAHRELLAIQEAYLGTPDNLDETNIAKLARGMIKEHLTLLGNIEKMG